ncbi:MAG: PAS domain-containing sensor histidine kinase [Bacteroidales bacterium]|nr:PAS domain-containing sensor histidine kinase [Bacteroidales bacterium]
MSDILNSTDDISRSREMYKLLAENIQDVIWIFNVSLEKLTYISPSIFRLRGFTVEEASKENFLDSLSPESAKIVSELLIERLTEFLKDPSKHQYYINELQQKCKDGSLVWIEATTQFQQNANGEIEVLGVSRRIQKRKEAEFEFKSKSEELERFFSLALDLLCIANADGYFLKLNKSWENTLGYNIEEIVNTRFLDYVHPDDVEKTMDAMSRLSSGTQVLNFENRYRAKDGTYKWIEWKSIPYGNSLIYAAARDITERKENELKFSELSLELHQLIKDKDRFISILAHDLRNPFNSLLGLSNLLVSERNQMNEEDVDNCVKTINQVSLQTYNLLEDLLMWYKSQAGRLPFEPKVFYVGDVCREVMDNLKIIASAKSITIECKKPEKAALFADVNMFKTVVRNLITNSIKFTPEKGKIGIDFSIDKGYATISIYDNGIGMDENQLAKIWDFNNNAGLGLVLCKEFTQKNGGTIYVESELGKGSRFSFTVPVPAM